MEGKPVYEAALDMDIHDRQMTRANVFGSPDIQVSSFRSSAIA
jgi:hypothetical protein